MPTYIKELPSKAELDSYLYEKDGFVYFKPKIMSRGRPSVKAGLKPYTAAAEGYWRVILKGESYALSRIVYQMHFGDLTPDFEVDHFDRNVNNNKIENLRKVRQAVNKRNKKKPKNNTTGLTGVALCRKKHPFPHQHKISEYYVARWYSIDGTLVGKCFNIEKMGKEAAFKAASEYRVKMILQLCEENAGYSETHGK